MELAPPPLLILLAISLLLTTTSTTPTEEEPSPPQNPHSTLDPKQLTALQSLNLPTTTQDPCSPTSSTTTTCDNTTPFRHLLSLHLTNCSPTLTISSTALKSLTSLSSLSFQNCPSLPTPHLPPQLSSNLHLFSSTHSLTKLSGVFLSRLKNLTSLTITSTSISASGPRIILSPMKSLQLLTISHTNLTGFLPKIWHLNLTHIDLSSNKLIGHIPISLTRLENLESLNLSANSLTGEIPSSIGDLITLKNLSLSSNSLSGFVPNSLSSMPELIHIDLSNNQLNGTLPNFITQIKNLKFLNLERNNFHGVMPYNATFIKKLLVFKIGGNSKLCFNHSTILSKLKLGIAPCDKYGLPLSPPPAKEEDGDGGGGKGADYGEDDEEEDADNGHDRHGPSKVVLGVAIGLSSMVFLIVFLVLLSKWCG